MIQYTTTTLHLMVRGVDLTPYEVHVTIEQGNKEYDLTDGVVTYDEGDDGATHIRVALSQAQTGSLRKGKCKVQVNWIDQSGNRNATVIKETEVLANLLDRVVEHGQ